MTGPRKIVELPSDPSQWRKLVRDGHHVHDGKLWVWVPSGCVLCVESAEWKDQTLQSVDDPEHYVCQNHGKLEKVIYSFQSQYTIQIGERTVTGSRRVEDFFLFPASQTSEERAGLLDKILKEAEEYENENDPLLGLD